MAQTLTIRRVTPSQQPGFHEQFTRVQKRLAAGSRPITPVVQFFARKLRESIRTDFNVGGRSPFPWAPDSRNTIASKGHSQVLKGRHGWKLRDSISVDTIILSAPTNYTVDVNVPEVGEFMQLGAKGPWTINPKPGGVLRFVVAEAREDFRARRNRALARRRAGGAARIPARPGQVVIFTRKPIRHPGYPARKFVVIRDGLLREGWRRPLQAFLFEGKVPR